MSIMLNSEQETFAERLLWRIVANLIATGSFQTAAEVLQVALKLLETERESYQLWVAQTREQVREGIESLDRGEGVDGETVVNDLLAKLQQAIDISV
jgi:antitoxin ParD1/3/4